MDLESMRHFRDQFHIPVPDDQLAELPYLKFPEDSAEYQYMRAQRMKLGGFLPSRRRKAAEPLPVPPLSAFDALLQASGDGREQKTAYKVVDISDEYFIIYAILGLNLRQQSLAGNCDVMTVYDEASPDDTVDIWFDVSLHLSALDKLFGGSDSRSHDSKAKKSGKKSKRKAEASLIVE